ncbi:MAG: hypothetical protein H0U77_00205 [Nocardioidaceae bacterium]|nr:hypothetical protein [Nocardioidaceae bacterium]
MSAGTSEHPDRPNCTGAGLRLAACLVAVEALALLSVAAGELLAVTPGRIGLGVSTALFFMACALGLGYAASGVWRVLGWSRGPVVVAQLLLLGVAVSTRDSLPWWAVGLAGWALAVLALVLRPAATRALAD